MSRPHKRPPGSMSIADFAEECGTTRQAVMKRMDRGTLTSACVGQDGVGRYISDPDEARRQWAANVDPQYVAAARPDADLVDGDDAGDPESVNRARQRYLNAKADMAEWERDKLRGELMLKTEHRAILAAAIVPRLTKLLGVPTRARQQLPHLTISDMEAIDAIQREALEGEEDSSLTSEDLDVIEAFCRERRAELAEPGAPVTAPSAPPPAEPSADPTA